MREIVRIQSLHHIDDTITKENAGQVAFLLCDHIGDRPFDMTIRDSYFRRPVVHIRLTIEEIIANTDDICIKTHEGPTGIIELDSHRYTMAPKIAINHLRIFISQWIPHRVDWSILLR